MIIWLKVSSKRLNPRAYFSVELNFTQCFIKTVLTKQEKLSLIQSGAPHQPRQPLQILGKM